MPKPTDKGPFIYDADAGLYFFEGGGRGYTLAEVEYMENAVEQHEEWMRRAIAERNEY